MYLRALHNTTCQVVQLRWGRPSGLLVTWSQHVMPRAGPWTRTWTVCASALCMQQHTLEAWHERRLLHWCALGWMRTHMCPSHEAQSFECLCREGLEVEVEVEVEVELVLVLELELELELVLALELKLEQRPHHTPTPDVCTASLECPHC